MPELIERIGLARSIQIVIEVWNELILLLLLSTMLIGIREDKTNELIKQVRIPLTKELVVFYAAVFLYDLCNIMDNLFGGLPTAFSYFVIRFGVFGYYLIGGFQTVFFLQVIKKHIAEALENERLRNIITGFQLLQIQEPFFPWPQVVLKDRQPSPYANNQALMSAHQKAIDSPRQQLQMQWQPFVSDHLIMP